MNFIQSLNIGKVIYERCKDLIKCYPIIADKGSEYPFMIYRRSGLSTDFSKDRCIYDTVTVELVIASVEYDESVRLVQSVKERLTGRYFNKEYGIAVANMKVIGASEGWNNDAYIQRLEIQMQVTA